MIKISLLVWEPTIGPSYNNGYDDSRHHTNCHITTANALGDGSEWISGREQWMGTRDAVRFFSFSFSSTNYYFN
jgi:hypothetical protein